MLHNTVILVHSYYGVTGYITQCHIGTLLLWCYMLHNTVILVHSYYGVTGYITQCHIGILLLWCYRLHNTVILVHSYYGVTGYITQCHIDILLLWCYRLHKAPVTHSQIIGEGPESAGSRFTPTNRHIRGTFWVCGYTVQEEPRWSIPCCVDPESPRITPRLNTI